MANPNDYINICEVCRSPNITIEQIGDIKAVPLFRVTCHNCGEIRGSWSKLYPDQEPVPPPDPSPRPSPQPPAPSPQPRKYAEAGPLGCWPCIIRFVIWVALVLLWVFIIIPVAADVALGSVAMILGPILLFIAAWLLLRPCFRKHHAAPAGFRERIGIFGFITMLFAALGILLGWVMIADADIYAWGWATIIISLLGLISPISQRRFFKLLRILFWIYVALAIVIFTFFS
jgi:hypothetical protein